MPAPTETADALASPFPWRRDFAVAGVVWFCFSLINASQVYLSMLDHGHSFPRMVAFNLAVWSIWALFTPLVHRLGRLWPLIPFRWPALFRHLAAALVAAALHTAAWTQLKLWIRPYDAMTISRFDGSFGQLFWIQVHSEVLIYLVVLGLSAAADFAQDLHRRQVEAGNLRSQLSEARLHSLELQLRPHFLFNTLNAISGLVRSQRNPEAVEMIVRLSDLLHQSLDSERRHTLTLARELALLRAYLEIEEVRFSDRLTLVFAIDDAALAALLPAFLLQPLAENAVRHGIAKVAAKGKLEIRARRLGEWVEVEIENSGPPLRQESATGLGLANSRARLRALFGARASLRLDDVEGGVCARLRLPYCESLASTAVEMPS